MTARVLGVDGGQTSTKMVIANLEGEVIWSAQVASAFSGLDDAGASLTAGGLERRLRELLQQTLSEPLHARPEPAEGACPEPVEGIRPERVEGTGRIFEMAVLGMSGAEPGSPLIGGFQAAVTGAVPARRYRVVHDAVTNLLGASAGQPGIVVIAGGGAVAYGVGEDGRSWAAGGWGYAVGDEGSGYSIGRAAINAVFRALDGRDVPTQLVEPLLQHFDVSGAVELKYAIFEGRVQFQDIAALPPLVAQLAAAGDGTARRILRGAGCDLAEAAVAVARSLDLLAAPVKVYLTGGLRRETRYLLPAFQEAILKTLPGALFPQPAFEPVIGTLFLAYRDLGRPIDDRLLRNLSESWARMRPAGFGEQGQILPLT